MNIKRYILPVIILAFAAMVSVSYTEGIYEKIMVAKAAEGDLDSNLADAATAQARLDDIKGKFATFPAGATQALNVILPDTVDPVLLIVEASASAERFGLTVKSPTVTVVTDPQSDTALYVKHKLSFTVSAPYSVFRSFLRDLESNLALHDSQNVGFTADHSSEGTVSLRSAPELDIHDYRIDVITYSLRP